MQYWSRQRNRGSAAGDYREVALRRSARFRRHLRHCALARSIAWVVAVALLIARPAQAEANGGISLRGELDGETVELPMLSAHYAVSVSGPLARTTLRQTFTNSSGQWLAATYRFPLPDDAAVDHLTVEAGGRRIVGEIQARETAKRTYEKARDSGRRAALVSQARANLFTTALANLAPGDVITVEIEFQQPVVRDGGSYQLRLPTTVTSRYAATGGGLEADASTTSAPAATLPAGSHALQVEIDLDTGLPIETITSHHHRIDVARQSTGHYAVSVAAPARLDADFVLQWTLADADAPRVTAFGERRDAQQYALFRIMPPLTVSADLAPPRELILVIDTSGSMQGVSIAEAIEALEIAIDGLRPADRFNVIAFDDEVNVLYPAPRAAIASTREDARGWLRQQRADGGTNMRPALAAALDTPPTAGYLRQVLFVTDGAVGNEAALFKDISRWIGASRLFTVGIGAAPNGWFMRKAADAGRGRFVLTSAAGGVGNAMQDLFARMAQPVLTDIEFDWGDATAEFYPQRVADLYAGEPIDVAARFDGALPQRLRLRATHWAGGIGRPWSHEVSLSELADADRTGVGVHWARAKLAALEDARRAGLPDPMVAAAMLEVAMAHHLVSAVTSLVAVDATPVRAAGPVQTSAVPGLLPRGQAPMAALTPSATDAPWLRLTGWLCLLAGSLLWALTGRRQRRLPVAV